MRHLRQLGAATFLTLTLTVSAWAGLMETGDHTPPPPSVSGVSVADTETPTQEEPAFDPAAEFKLNLLQMLVSML